MDRFEYSTSDIYPNESIILSIDDTELLDGEKDTDYCDGELILTSHRLLWKSPATKFQPSGYLSLYLKYVVYIEEDKSVNFKFREKGRINVYVMEAPLNQPGPLYCSIFNYFKIKFTADVDYEFVAALQHVLQDKKWESHPIVVPPLPKTYKLLRNGIVGIERGLQNKQNATVESISVAFQDLNKLMEMAKDMVSLSKNISSKIREKQGDITDDETVKFKSYLLSLGIDDPVTRDAFNNESEYFCKLAHEITQIIEKPLSEVGGLMALTDVYCRVNRARGLELLSPDDFLDGCKMLQKIGASVVLRQFDSGVKVLQLASHSDEVIVEDTKNLLKGNTFLTAEDLARILGISVVLAKERLATTEKFGKACRDESIEGVRFYSNRFLEDME